MTPEAIVETYLDKQVKLLGGITRKTIYQGRRYAPDRQCFLPDGHLIIVECKAKQGKLSCGQKMELKRLRQLGFNAVVVSSKEEIDKLLEGYRNG